MIFLQFLIDQTTVILLYAKYRLKGSTFLIGIINLCTLWNHKIIVTICVRRVCWWRADQTWFISTVIERLVPHGFSILQCWHLCFTVVYCNISYKLQPLGAESQNEMFPCPNIKNLMTPPKWCECQSHSYIGFLGCPEKTKKFRDLKGFCSLNNLVQS